MNRFSNKYCLSVCGTVILLNFVSTEEGEVEGAGHQLAGPDLEGVGEEEQHCTSTYYNPVAAGSSVLRRTALVSVDHTLSTVTVAEQLLETAPV